MKRSEINENLRWAVELMDKYQFKLPRFAQIEEDEPVLCPLCNEYHILDGQPD